MAIEKATGYLVDTGRRLQDGKPLVTYLNREQMERAWDSSLVRSKQNQTRLPDPTAALRVVPLYGRGA